MSTWTAPVTGLTGRGCVTTVNKQLSALEGVNSVDIDLVEGGISTVTLESSRDLADDEVAAALSAGGAFHLAR